MVKTTDLVAAMRCSSQAPTSSPPCTTCAYRVVELLDGKEYAGCDCDRMGMDAADKIEELVDRCARYAEEIAVLRERGKRAVEDTSPYAAATERQAVGGGVPDAPDGTEKIYGDTGLTAEDAAALQKDWSDLCTVVGECGGLDRVKELTELDKDGRVAILPCKPDGVMLDMSDPERPELMKKLHFAVAYVRCGIVFHQPYKIFSENVAAGHIRPVSSSAEKMLGEEV